MRHDLSIFWAAMSDSRVLKTFALANTGLITHGGLYSSTTLRIYLNFVQVKSMDDNCGEWVEFMSVVSWCGE